jgi:hypothetical protein
VIGGDKELTAVSVKAGQWTRQPLGRPARASVAYRIARWLEAYAFTATPERIGVQEGLRAATAVSVIVAAATWLQWPGLSWAAFGAFGLVSPTLAALTGRAWPAWRALPPRAQSPPGSARRVLA